MKKIIVGLLCIVIVSCSRTAKVTLVDEKGETISFIDEIPNLNGKSIGNTIPVTVIQTGNKVSYAAPFNIVSIAKKGKKFNDGSIYLGQKYLKIQSIKFD